LNFLSSALSKWIFCLNEYMNLW